MSLICGYQWQILFSLLLGDFSDRATSEVETKLQVVIFLCFIFIILSLLVVTSHCLWFCLLTSSFLVIFHALIYNYFHSFFINLFLFKGRNLLVSEIFQFLVSHHKFISSRSMWLDKILFYMSGNLASIWWHIFGRPWWRNMLCRVWKRMVAGKDIWTSFHWRCSVSKLSQRHATFETTSFYLRFWCAFEQKSPLHCKCIVVKIHCHRLCSSTQDIGRTTSRKRCSEVKRLSTAFNLITFLLGHRNLSGKIFRFKLIKKQWLG